MAHREVGLGRLKSLADTAGRKMTETTKAAAERAAEVAGDAQEAARRTADHAKSGAAGVTDAVSSLVRPKKKETVDLSQLPDSAKLLYCRVLLDLVAEDERCALTTLLVRDLIRISRADNEAAETERAQIVRIASLAFPDSAEKVTETTEAVVIAEEEFAAGKITTSQLEARTKDLVAKAAAFGAPLAAISFAGSVGGLSAAGITSGLAALGIGGVLGLSAMVTGIGTVVILGVVVHQGVRFLLGTNERERAKRRESLIQQVIQNHQQAMADLTEDIATLAGRMDAYLADKTRNEERLAALRGDLASFQQALVDLQISRKAYETGDPVNA